jgi:hypothetical protein
MPRRIDIELTSHAGGAWTWRAAGARQPKGTVAETLLPGPASVGDVLRAEVETGLDGIEIVALSAPQAKAEAPAGERIEVLGSPRRGPDVSVTLAPGSRRREGGPRREVGPRRGAPGRRPHGDRAGGPARERTGGPPRERASGTSPERAGGTQDDRAGRARGERSGGGGQDDRAGGPQRARERDRDRKLPTSTTHRNAMLASLGPEQLPVAEQLLRGGIPAVRSAVAEQKGPAANAEQLLAIAEQLLPAVNLASWKDRAAAAQAAGKELRLRDLRAVVTASRTVTLDEEGRALAKTLREALDLRVKALREDWVSRIRSATEGGRVLDALRAANRPPDFSTRLPAELAVAMADAAGTAMAADVDTATWLALLDAVVDSPVRRTVKPAGIPDAPEAQEAARRAAGSVPELAKLLGLRIPPPPPRRVRVSAGGGAGPAAAP